MLETTRRRSDGATIHHRRSLIAARRPLLIPITELGFAPVRCCQARRGMSRRVSYAPTLHLRHRPANLDRPQHAWDFLLYDVCFTQRNEACCCRLIRTVHRYDALGTITLLMVHRSVTSIREEQIEAFGSSGHRMKTYHLWSI